MKITSKENSLIKLAVSLKQKKYALEHRLCLVEGEKIVSECFSRGLLKNIFIEENKMPKYSQFAGHSIVHTITSELAAKLSETVTTSGIFATAEFPEQQPLNTAKNFIVLDGLQNPDNVGAILRSALAFGVKQAVFVESVFPYSSKLLRSSMGTVFNINIIPITRAEFANFAKQQKLNLVIAGLNGTPLKNYKKTTASVGLVVGNEGNGISKEISELTKNIVTIEMDSSVESLNAAVSAGILMYHLFK